MKTVKFELPHGTELHTLDELSRASTVANQIQSALVIWTATWNYIYQDLILDTHVDTKGKSLLVTLLLKIYEELFLSKFLVITIKP